MPRDIINNLVFKQFSRYIWEMLDRDARSNHTRTPRVRMPASLFLEMYLMMQRAHPEPHEHMDCFWTWMHRFNWTVDVGSPDDQEQRFIEIGGLAFDQGERVSLQDFYSMTRIPVATFGRVPTGPPRELVGVEYHSIMPWTRDIPEPVPGSPLWRAGLGNHRYPSPAAAPVEDTINEFEEK